MADSLISKPFNEGAPLDPNALNDLRTDLLNTYAKANALYNDTKNGQTQAYRYIFNCGEIPLAIDQVSTPIPVALDLGTGFEASPTPIITATIRMTSAPSKDQNTSVYLTSSGGANQQLWVVSNVKKTVYIQWTAIQKLPA
jgi:hypothetical protein